MKSKDTRDPQSELLDAVHSVDALGPEPRSEDEGPSHAGPKTGRVPDAWNDDQGRKKTFLREKLIEFQLQISRLHSAIKEQEERFRKSEEGLFSGLFEILDAFENLEERVQAREGEMDKAGKRLAGNVRSIQRKLIRLLKSRGVVQMTFPDGRASMETCKVVDTEPFRSKENQTILSVVKNGYVRKDDNRVLRKAEVITVANAPAGTTARGGEMFASDPGPVSESGATGASAVAHAPKDR